MVTLRHLVVFVTVCQEGTITAAANKLFLVQPSVSQAIKELETHLGHPLFERYARKLYLTPFGKDVLTYARNILALYDEIELLCSSKHYPDTIRLGTGTALGKLIFPKFIKQFGETNPTAKIFVHVDRTDLNALALTDNSLDFVIMESIPDTPNILKRPLHCSEIVAICHKDHPLAKKKVVTAAELAKCNLLLRERSSPTFMAVETFFLNNNITLTPMWESISVMALINAVAENLGIAFLSLNHIQAVPDNRIVILHVEGFDAVRYINFYYHKDKKFTPLMEQFTEEFTKYVNTMMSR